MGPDTIKAIQDALAPLASKLGAGAAHVYQVFVHQQYVQGIAELIGVVGFFTGSIILAILARGLYKKHVATKEDPKAPYYDDGWAVGAVFATVLSLMAVIFMFAMAADATMRLLNPEYYGIKDILCTVKSCN